MEKKKTTTTTDKPIELRSPKVRNLIGEIPENLVTCGYIFIFIAFLLICDGVYWFLIKEY